MELQYKLLKGNSITDNKPVLMITVKGLEDIEEFRHWVNDEFGRAPEMSKLQHDLDLFIEEQHHIKSQSSGR